MSSHRRRAAAGGAWTPDAVSTIRSQPRTSPRHTGTSANVPPAYFERAPALRNVSVVVWARSGLHLPSVNLYCLARDCARSR
jgi:hypothetical protein